MIVLKPPVRDELHDRSIFLAGSIEMNKASDWQKDVEERLSDIDNLTVLNPRRDDWNSDWEQTITNEHFKGQVDWELDMLERASIILLYLEPGTLSPISLLELGLFANTGRLVVCCPEGFWRKGNVDVVCTRHGIEVFESLDAALEAARDRLDC